MIWARLPEIERGTIRAHWFAYCWACQHHQFMPGMFLMSQLYLNPFVHTEPICEDCARKFDPNFGHGTMLEIIDRELHITKGDEPECPHKGRKSYFSVLPSLQIILACSYECAKKIAEENEIKWQAFCKILDCKGEQ